MEVAVVAVKVMEGAVDEVVDVIAVRDGRVPAPGAMLRRAFHGCAGRGPAVVDIEDVIRDDRAGGRMEMPVVEIIRVIAMTDGPMPAARPVLVGMVVPVLQSESPSWQGSIDPAGVRGQAGTERA